LIATLALSFLSPNTAQSAEVKAYFSPYEGKKAFAEIFKQIASAEDYVYVTIYSWSMKNKLEEAIQSACDNGAQVFAVVNNDQKQTKEDIEAGKIKKLIEKKKDDILPLLKSCAMFKYSNKTMHEKFVVVDDRFAVNTSANYSTGAVSQYSENFIFAYDDQSKENEWSDTFIRALKQEFEFLYNFSYDPDFAIYFSEAIFEELVFSHGNRLDFKPTKSGALSFYSSGMNKFYTLKTRAQKGKAFMGHKLYDCQKNGESKKTSVPKSCDDPSEATASKLVVDMIADYVGGAKHSIYLGVNYLTHSTVCDAVKGAVKRGLDVRIVTDNKQINSSRDCTRILSKQYADRPEIANKLRYKTYSHQPARVNNYLQHSKYLLIDYREGAQNPVSEDTKLISGSHNISFKAENDNFENMVVFESEQFSNLYQRFYSDFQKLYSWGRSDADKVSNSQIDKIIKKTSRGSYKIHYGSKDTVTSMTLREAASLRKELEQRAPGMFDADKETLENCMYYNPKTKKYSGGRSC
jgi:phosphatidylserine/phosphatidylglycerophosphate/cardiolipin synthase-like enzyme